MASQTRKIEPALVVHKTNYGNDGLIWLPKREQQCHSKELASYNIAEWVLYDFSKEKIVGPNEGEPPFETRIWKSAATNYSFIQVKVPLVYFSDKKFNEIVAYASGFGRVGSFARQNDLKMDKFYYAWIAFAEFYKNADFQLLMFVMNVKWIVAELNHLMNLTEISGLSYAKSFITTGIVIKKETVNGNGQDENQSYMVIKFYSKSDGLCEYRMSRSIRQPEIFSVGTWARFVPIQNNSMEITAVSPFAVDTPKGVTLTETEPKIKLTISHDQYSLDHDSSVNVIHVPLIGDLQCTRSFAEELRKLRQKQKHFQPRLYIEFDHDIGHWCPVLFDGMDNEPPPRSRSPQQRNTPTSPAPNERSNEPGFGRGGSGRTKKSDFLSFDRSQPMSSSMGGTRRNFPTNKNRGNGAHRTDFSSSALVPHKPKVQTNLSGIIVSIASANSFFVYTPEFPGEEIRLCRRVAPEDAVHGSWIKFDVELRRDGEKIISRCALDTNPPTWKVTPIRNTVHLELTAYLPKKWCPDIMAPEERVFPTDWINDVLDRQGLLTRELADSAVKVLVERKKDPKSGKSWHVKEII